jgi:integrase
MKTHTRQHRDGPLKVQANHGIFKRCDHGRKKWKTCACPWYANFSFRGVAHRVSLLKRAGKPAGYAMLKTEADTIATTWRAEIVARATEPEAARASANTIEYFTDLCDLYLDRQVRKRTRRDRARAETERHVERLRDAFPVRVEAITQRAVDDWRAAFGARVDERQQQVNANREKQGHQESRLWGKGGQVMINRLLARLSHMLRWAADHDHIARHPYVKDGRTAVKLDREAEVGRDRRLEGDEEQRLMAHAGPHLQDVIVCCLASAMRIGEVLALQWRHVALDQREIRIPAQLTKSSVKRDIPIMKALLPVLNRRRGDADGAVMTPQQYVFGTETGEHIASVRVAWNATCRRAGIEDLHIHDLRREAGSRLLEGGATIQDVKTWLGHTRIETTAKYLATSTGRLHDVARRIDGEGALAQTLPTPTGAAETRPGAAPLGAAVSV